MVQDLRPTSGRPAPLIEDLSEGLLVLLGPDANEQFDVPPVGGPDHSGLTSLCHVP